MSYGKIKVDTITFTSSGVDQSITVSGIVQSISGNITATGTVQANVVIGTTLVSGGTVTGNAGAFNSLTGNTAGFTTVTGAIVTGTTANFVSGVFTSQISGNTITGNTVKASTITGVSGVYTTQLSGATVTGNVGSFTTITGGTATITSGVFGAGTASLPSISFSSDPNTGIYSPGADQVAISTGGNAAATFNGASGSLAQGAITYSATSFALAGGGATEEFTVTKTGVDILSLGVDSAGPRITSLGDLRFATNSTERLRIDSAGLVGVGTSSPGAELNIVKNLSGGLGAQLIVENEFGNAGSEAAILCRTNTACKAGLHVVADDGGTGTGNGNYLYFTTTPGGSTTETQRMTITRSGNVGMGTSSPGYALDIVNNSTYQLRLASSTSNYASGGLYLGAAGTGDPYYYGYVRWNQASTTLDLAAQDGTGSGGLRFLTNGGTTSPTERARIDVSGRLLVGTSSARANFFNSTSSAAFQLEGTGTNRRAAIIGDDFEGSLILASQKSGSVGGNTVLASGDPVGAVTFQGSDGSEFVEAASIYAYVDGTPGANDMPGRLVFSTTADGASSPTERMRISQNGVVTIKSASDDISIGGSVGTTVWAANRCGIHFGTPASVIPTDGSGTLTDNACSLGFGAYRWSVVYAGTGTINTSDLANKQDIESLSGLELNVAASIKTLIKKYRFKDAVESKGDEARIHVGVIAQEVEQAFVDKGLDPRRYALFCEDELEDGSKRLGIRYDELLAFVIAAL